jgi:hypothetical protein
VDSRIRWLDIVATEVLSKILVIAGDALTGNEEHLLNVIVSIKQSLHGVDQNAANSENMPLVSIRRHRS